MVYTLSIQSDVIKRHEFIPCKYRVAPSNVLIYTGLIESSVIKRHGLYTVNTE